MYESVFHLYCNVLTEKWRASVWARSYIRVKVDFSLQHFIYCKVHQLGRVVKIKILR